MSDAYDRIIRPAVKNILRAEASASIEEACERSLTDPQQRGVAVHFFANGLIEVGLSPSVPYGEMHEWFEPGVGDPS